MMVNDDDAEQRLIAALRATAAAVAADSEAEVGAAGRNETPADNVDFVLDITPIRDHNAPRRGRRWLQVTVAAGVAAAIAGVVVLLAGTGPSRVQPGGPGHRSPTPSVPFATSSQPPNPSRSCIDKPGARCASLSLSNGTPGGSQP